MGIATRRAVGERPVTIARKFEELIRHSPVAVLEVSADGRVALAHGKAEAAWGSEGAELVGRTVHDLFEEHESFLEALSRAAIGQPVQTVLENEEFVFDVHLVPLESENGRHPVIVVATDVTEQHALVEMALKMHRKELVGRLAEGTAHDLNNVLTVILGHIEIVRMHTDENLARRGRLDKIFRAGHEAATLSRQLLLFGRTTSTSSTIVDLCGTLRGLERMLRRLVGDKGSWDWNVPIDELSVECDPAKLEMLIVSLVANAAQLHTGDHFSVEVRRVDSVPSTAAGAPGSVTGQAIVLEVRHSGRGPSADCRRKILEAFTADQLPPELDIDRATQVRLIRQMRARFQLEQPRSGGCVARVFLPAARKGPKSKRPNVRHLPCGHTVLVVDDNVAIRGLLRDFLLRRGYAVLTAASGEDAMQLASRHRGRIHLMLTDVLMQHMNGSELATQFAKSWPKTKVLFVSGASDETLVAHGVSPQSDRVLRKPFKPQSLYVEIEQLLNPAAATELRAMGP